MSKERMIDFMNKILTFFARVLHDNREKFRNRLTKLTDEERLFLSINIFASAKKQKKPRNVSCGADKL
jgi:hypothetical protein